MAFKIKNRNIWAVVALIGIIIPYSIYMVPFPTESTFSHIEDSTTRKDAVLINMRAWFWSFAIVFSCFVAAILSLRSNQKWRYFAGIGAVLVIIFQSFPFTFVSLLLTEVATYSQFIGRVSLLMDYPMLLQGILIFDMSTPLLSIIIIYLVAVETYEQRKNTPSNKQLKHDAQKARAS